MPLTRTSQVIDGLDALAASGQRKINRSARRVEEKIAAAVGKVKTTGDDKRDLKRMLKQLGKPLFVAIGAMDKDDDLAAAMTQAEGIGIAASTPRGIQNGE